MSCVRVATRRAAAYIGVRVPNYRNSLFVTLFLNKSTAQKSGCALAPAFCACSLRAIYPRALTAGQSDFDRATYLPNAGWTGSPVK